MANWPLTVVTGVVDLNVLEGAGAGVTEDGGVHGYLALGAALTPGSDHPQCPGTHTVD